MFNHSLKKDVYKFQEELMCIPVVGIFKVVALLVAVSKKYQINNGLTRFVANGTAAWQLQSNNGGQKAVQYYLGSIDI